MTGTGLLRRILLTLPLACGFLLFLGAIDGYATPIHPDIRRIVSQPQQGATAQSMPARAGWDGPEMRAGPRPGAGSTASAALARAERAELVDAATPDPRAILSIAVVIFLLRLLRREKHVLNGSPRSMRAPTINRPASTTEQEDHRIAA
jgi:hypothetical protein